MKKIAFLLTITILLFSCGTENTDQLTAELDKIKQENEDLKLQTQQISEKDSLLNEYAEFIFDIQNNLDKIRNKENTVLMPNAGDAGSQSAESIKSDLQDLGALLADNKKKIAVMKSRLSNSNVQIDELEKVVRNLSKQAEEREIKILGMKGELSDMGVAFDELMTAYEENMALIAEKNETIEEQDSLLHAVYYAFGTKKELSKNNVITSEGGLIGIGKTKKLKNDFNKEYFTKINSAQTKEIILGVKKASLITTHPDGSYELVGDKNVEKIKILDTEKFWSVSKYLVVVTK